MRRVPFGRVLLPWLVLPSLLLACEALKSAAPSGAEGAGDDDEGAPSDIIHDEPDSASSTRRDSGTVTTNDGAAKEAGPGNEPAPCTVDTCTRETFLDGLYGPVSIASSGQYLYFVEVGLDIPQGGGWAWLSRVRTDKSCTMRSCFDIIEPYALAGELQGQYIYETHLGLGPNHVCLTQSYNASSSHSITCYDLVGFKKASLEGGSGYVVDLWVGASDARWALGSTTPSSADGAVRGSPLVGGSPTPMATGRLRVTSVTSDGTVTYFTERGSGSNTGVVGAVGTSGSVVELATGRTTPTAVALYGGYVYWAEIDARKIMRVKADGTSTPEAVANTCERPFALAVDTTGVYWACVGPGASGVEGSIAHTTTAPNGPVDVMMTALPSVYDLAVDATHVYAATVGAQIHDGVIFRIPKTR